MQVIKVLCRLSSLPIHTYVLKDLSVQCGLSQPARPSLSTTLPDNAKQGLHTAAARVGHDTSHVGSHGVTMAAILMNRDQM